jgi:hypothetical protein
MTSKKGIYYSTDALLAGLLLVGVAMTLLSLSYYEPAVEQKTFLSEDLLNVLSAIPVMQVTHPFVVDEIANGNITNLDNTVLEQMGEYWALNQTDKATYLFTIVTNNSLSSSMNIAFFIEDDELFLQNDTAITNLVTTRRMISGIAKGAPIAGSSSSAYLKRVRNKKTNAYAYFGGFYGQGNITVQLPLPADFDATRLIASELKIETPGTFQLYINGAPCDGLRTGLATQVSTWDVSSCNASFLSGDNDILLSFTSSLNTSYVSGGFLKVVHTTDTLQEPATPGYKRYYFPEIRGFINLYDAFSAQGLIKNWTLNMTLYNEYDTFVTLGNETIFVSPGQNATQRLVYSRYDQNLPPTQIPLRVGTTNLTNITVVDEGLPSDSFLVTDVSGSMTDCGQYYTEDVAYCSYDYRFWLWWIYTECPFTGSCSANECGGSTTTQNHAVYDKTVTTCNATYMDIAQDAAHLFVDTILTDSLLHRIGLVDYATNANTPTDLTNAQGILHSEIDTYVANGATCSCCGINRARDLLLASSNNKFIVFLSDGDANRHCGGDLHTYTSQGSTTSQARADAIAAAQEACNNNVTVFAIGFGEGMSSQGHQDMQQIACNSSLYYNATDVDQLAQVYEEISNRILVAANYSSQTLNIVGNYSLAQLFEDSYIDLYFEPISQSDKQGKLSLTFESDQFNGCSANIFLPDQVEIIDAYVTSFSGKHWTKEVVVNGITVFNLTEYGTDYVLLGDPFIVQIPSFALEPGVVNSIQLAVGDGPTNSSSCSANNTLIYTALINASTPRSQTFAFNEGCNWTIESENGLFSHLLIPSTYSGTKECFYTASNISYNPLDAYDFATHSLLRQLDPDGNGKTIVDLTEADLEITITLVSGVPYLWGPSMVQTRVWN